MQAVFYKMNNNFPSFFLVWRQLRNISILSKQVNSLINVSVVLKCKQFYFKLTLQYLLSPTNFPYKFPWSYDCLYSGTEKWILFSTEVSLWVIGQFLLHFSLLFRNICSDEQNIAFLSHCRFQGKISIF